MSTETHTTMRCDDADGLCMAEVVGDSVGDVRRQGRDLGWKHERSAPFRDLCPDHAEGAPDGP